MQTKTTRERKNYHRQMLSHWGSQLDTAMDRVRKSIKWTTTRVGQYK